MFSYVLRKLVSLAITLIVATMVVFTVVEVIPGDPAAFMLGVNAREDTLKALRDQMGLNRPLIVRYVEWVSGMLRGDFGTSWTYKTPVAGMIADRARISVPLALYALGLSMLIAFPAGIFAASRRGRAGDIGVVATTQFGMAVPNFWFAMILVLIFAVRLRWFNAGGFPGWEDPLGAIGALTLPAIALALPQAAILTRIMRSALLDMLEEDFVRTARAKGLTRNQVLWRHAVRNALIPVLTVTGLQFSFLIAGAIVIEQVFFLPGLGRLIFQAIGARDLIVVESVVVVLVCAVVAVNFAVDLAYALVDPRLRMRR